MATRGWVHVRMAMALYLVLALMVALAMDKGEAKGPLMGGWDKAKVDDESTAVLIEALAKPVAAADRKKIEHRVCVREVVALEQQVVSGMNYRYHVKGLEVPSDGNGDAKMGWCAKTDKREGQEKQYVIRVYEQAWTNTLKVVSITEEKETTEVKVKVTSEGEGQAKEEAKEAEDGKTKLKVSIHMNGENTKAKTKAKAEAEAAEGVSAAEKQAIDQWIKEQDLNEYGDRKDLMYPGGTPLFDETTGTRIDRYDYIISKHPERPWSPTSRAKVQSVKLSAGSPSQQASTSTKTSALTIVGVLGGTALFVGLMVVGRTRIEQRHAKYEVIRNGRVNN